MMKPGIIIVSMAALALSVFAASEVEANWWGGPDVNQRFSGQSLTIGVDAATGNTTILQSGLARGKPGRGEVNTVLVRTTDFVFNPGGACPEGFPLESQVIRFEWGETFNDGSLLSGVGDLNQVVCLDLEQTALVAELTGTITGGTRRFEGASGTWAVTNGVVPIGTTLTTAKLMVDLD